MIPLLIVGPIVSLAAALAGILDEGTVGILIAIPLLAIGGGLPLWILRSTFYIVDGTHLRVRSGPFRTRIPRSGIRSVTPVRSILSAPALSSDRLRVHYGRFSWVDVSPSDPEAFRRALGEGETNPLRHP